MARPPHDFAPHWNTAYAYFKAWSRDGTPSVRFIDSQSVKTTETGGERGYDGAKKLVGRKRHLFVDTEGLPIRVLVPPAPAPLGRRGLRWEPVCGVGRG